MYDKALNPFRSNIALVQLFSSIASKGTDKWSSLELRSLLQSLKPFSKFTLADDGLTVSSTPRGPRVSAWLHREVTLERVLWMHLYSEGSSDINVQVTIQHEDNKPQDMEFTFDTFRPYSVQGEQMPAITAATALHALGTEVANRLKTYPGLMPGLDSQNALAAVLGTTQFSTYQSPARKTVSAVIDDLGRKGLSPTGRNLSDQANPYGDCWGHTMPAGL